MHDLNFLDLYSGSGAVGVEALSRGATNVYAIEDHSPTAGIATKNFELPHEIAAWSAWLELNGPGGADGHEWVASVLKGHKSARDDIRSFADLLDFDDYVSFGGAV